MATTINAQEWRQAAERNIPSGKVVRKMKIIKASMPNAWYKNMIGREIEVHFFATFGVWDTEGRWLCYYDLEFGNSF